ncbi:MULTISPECIES: acriflavin resistance protein [unclassified Bradyrhizobium]|uniref:acriflavin resistance protein n=1 Tax=unclassified Bradyrhizobium TaxID=2631580 RepID=UPI00211E74B1|nr:MULTISPECIES: acriflavin resistance protein [unclassified Bradyrhizobium]MDD1536240.1 acriflavin resistance protein [Bradyrhizobium sp. WBOS8]MDD1586000.1 acriflavin resistance protein [Bradyrhizobium sp. WBOS4]UUO48511.1 acriflavin resistance protein [Bradyrhizobium sp. WBOS04]UUO62131.1 acriflavin resistance protein [Bradyrhizobium sp. WBOS08]
MTTLSSLWTLSTDGQLGILMSALSGIAMALAVALAMTVYFRLSYRSWRDVARHGLAALAALALFAFAAYDMRHAALAYLGLNPSKPAVEFEIRMPREMLTAMTDSQIELHTDRNQTLALIGGVRDLADGRALLRGAVALNHRTADRMLVVNLPGKGTFEFRLRLPAEPHRTGEFGPWHLADRIASPLAGPIAPQDGYTIRYRVL